jgi:biopolymer transport protein ExbD
MATKKPRASSLKVEEADMKPFMNLMVVLIPMLLLSAEFAKIAVIDIKLPENRGSQTKQAVTDAPKENKDDKLLLTAIITDSVVTLGAKGGFLPTIFYREYHKYVAKDDNAEFTVEYKPGEKVRHPKSSREMEIYERYDILLYATDENRQIRKCLYSKYGELVTNAQGEAVTQVAAGDTVWALTNPRRALVVQDASEFQLLPMSAYDELKNRLMKIKDRFRESQPVDGDDIIIAAEDEVLYDKIVQIMDAARAAEFPNISIAKLRG